MALEWLAPSDRDWVTRNQYLLEAIWARFEIDGKWPDPVDVLRELRSADRSRRVNAALAEMPTTFAQRDYAPPRLVLSIFGLACCNGAQLLLYQYLDVSRLALQQFDSPSLPNQLSRTDVVAELDLDQAEADRLSDLLMRDAPFLASGSSGLGDWDREIDPRVEEFDGIEDTESLIEFLAGQRRIATGRDPATGPVIPNPPLPNPEAVAPQPGSSADSSASGQAVSDPRASVLFWAALASALATVASGVVAVVRSPSVLGLSILGGLAGLTAGLFWMRSRRYLVALAVIVGAGLGLVVGVSFVSHPPGGPYRYFVSSTGGHDAIVGVIEPHPGAALATETVLGLGGSVVVKCLRREEGKTWAQLPNGSFVPAGLLRAEVGGQPAPKC